MDILIYVHLHARDYQNPGVQCWPIKGRQSFATFLFARRKRQPLRCKSQNVFAPQLLESAFLIAYEKCGVGARLTKIRLMKDLKIVFLAFSLAGTCDLYAAQEVLVLPSNVRPESPAGDLQRRDASFPASSSGIPVRATSTDFLMGQTPLGLPEKSAAPGETVMNINETGDEYNGSQSNVTRYPDKKKELFQGVWSNSNPGFDREEIGLREMRERWTSTLYDADGKASNEFSFEDQTLDRKENNELIYHEHSYWVDGLKQYEEKSGKEKNDFGQVIREYDWREMNGAPRIGYEYQIRHSEDVPVEIIYTQWAGDKGSFVIRQLWQEMPRERNFDPESEGLTAEIRTTIKVYDRYGKLTFQDEKMRFSTSRLIRGVSLEEILSEG